MTLGTHTAVPHNRRGSMLMFALVMLFLLSALCISIAESVALQQRLLTQASRRLQATCLSEAARSRALAARQLPWEDDRLVWVLTPSDWEVAGPFPNAGRHVFGQADDTPIAGRVVVQRRQSSHGRLLVVSASYPDHDEQKRVRVHRVWPEITYESETK